MDTLVPMLAVFAAIGVMIGSAILINKRSDRRRQRYWEKGKFGAAGLGSGFSAGGCTTGGAGCGASGGCGGAGGAAALRWRRWLRRRWWLRRGLLAPRQGAVTHR